MKADEVRVLVASDRHDPQIVLPDGEGITVLGNVANGHQAVARVLAEEPDLVLIDARLSDITAAAACRRIHEWSPDTKLLTVTELDNERAYETVISGAHGAILLDSSPIETADAVRFILSGGSIIMSRMAMRMLHDVDEWAKQSADPLYPPPSLTSTERQVVAAIGDGLTTRTIADLYDVTPQLVRLHAGFAISKLHKFALGWGKITQRVK